MVYDKTARKTAEKTATETAQETARKTELKMEKNSELDNLKPVEYDNSQFNIQPRDRRKKVCADCATEEGVDLIRGTKDYLCKGCFKRWLENRK